MDTGFFISIGCQALTIEKYPIQLLPWGYLGEVTVYVATVNKGGVMGILN